MIDDITTITPEVMPAEGTVEGLPVTSGHQWTLAQETAFQAFCDPDFKGGTGRINYAVAQAGISRPYFLRVRKQSWWKERWETWIMLKQQEFHTELAARQGEITKSYFKVINGERSDAKSANAEITAVKLFTEMGKEPIKNNRPMVAITTNIQNNNLKIGDGKELRGLTQEQLNHYARTGELPERTDE